MLGAGSPAALWDRIGASESTPPLFYALAWSWSQLVGDRGEATLRTVSAVATIAAVPVAYCALRRLVGVRPALATAAIVAVSPVLVGYALDARAYGLLVLVALLSVWALGALLERTTPRRWLLWAVACAAVIWTHWFGGFLVLGEAVALLWLRPGAWRALALACGGVLLSLLPLLGLLRDQTGDERAGFIGGYGIGGRLEQLARQFAMGENVPRTWLELAGLALAAGGVVVGTAIALRRAAGERGASPATGGVGEADGARALLAIVLVALLVPLALTATDLYDRFSIRNVLYLLPPAAALASLALVRLRAIPLAAYLALATLAVVWVHTDWRYDRSDWRAVARLVRAGDARAGDGAPVIAATRLGVPVATLYLRRGPAAAPLTTRRAWLVVEPVRPPGERAFEPVAAAAEASLAAAFPDRRERVVHGFRVIELTSPRAVTLAPGTLPGATLYPPAPR